MPRIAPREALETAEMEKILRNARRERAEAFGELFGLGLQTVRDAIEATRAEEAQPRAVPAGVRSGAAPRRQP